MKPPVKKYTISDMHGLASNRGGKCLSTEYKNAHTKLIWQCGKGHVWDSTPNTIRRGYWCGECSGNKLKSINDMHNLAKSKNGKCLSTEYKGVKTKLEWECQFGHKFFLTPDNVIQSQWCKKCSRKRVSENQKGNIETMHNYASERRGKCLSTEYINSRTKLKWQCKENHIFYLTPNDVQQKTWCEKCGRKSSALKRMDSIENVRLIAKSRGGNCLSEVYKGNKEKLEWECKEGHQWETTPACIKNGAWCPSCADLFYIGETKCRLYFETIFNSKFPKVRPKWFRNQKGNIMELDGYSEILKIAFEYQGIQHYKIDNFINKTESDLEEKIKNDLYKKHLCDSLGIVLFVIDYDANIVEEIKKQVIRYGLDITKLNFESEIDFEVLNDPVKIKEMQEVADKKSGKCLSTIYINAMTHLIWECKEGHQWKATPNNVKNNGRWCAKCTGKIKGTIEGMQELAKSNDGFCLSKNYINARSKLRWQCKEGHSWDAVPYSIKAGSWCDICKNKKYPEKIKIEAKKLYEKGYTYPFIIKELGIKSRFCVSRWVKKYNWQRN